MMRKLLILMAVAVVAMPSVGCASRCRNLFRRGAPCGTTVTPAALSAPLAIGRPFRSMVTTPSVECCNESSPVCEDSCDNCENGWTTGYADGACSECGATAPVTSYDEGYVVPSTTSSTVAPQGSSPRYDPGPADAH